MSASSSDKITDTFNSANPNVAKVTGTRSALGTTLTCDNLAGWPTGSGVHFSTYQIDTNNAVIAGTQIDWEGVVSGNSVGSLVRQAGATDNGNSIGDIVEMNPTGAWGHGLFTGFTAQHSQLDGSHKAITSLGLTNTGAFSQTGATTLAGSWDGWVGANESWAFASSTTITVPTDATTKYDIGDYIKITQSAAVKYFVITGVAATVLTVTGLTPGSLETVANSAITANAYSKLHNPHGIPVTNGVWKAYAPTFANTTLGNGTVTGAYTQVGKTVYFRARFVLGTTSAVSSGPTVSLPVASVALTVDTPLGIAIILDGGIADYPGTLYWATTTTASPQVTNAASTYAISNGITATVPITFGSTDNIYVQGTYEAA